MSRWLCILCCSAVLAASELAIERAWARASLPGAEAGAVYALIRGGARDDRLVAASSPVCAHCEVHEHVRDQRGLMQMREVAGGLAIPAGAALELQPGGYHIMLIGLHQPLRVGQRFPLTLQFAQAGPRELTVEVLAPWAMSWDDRE
ncbi:MAG: copper chaperone PCu(A)C [Planctomycetota bacterium]|nr:copper chaperone PCu(A)C [Planctomycetota bacterium]MCX8039906.1 copper chaperone PCu(A)C [Planctomycetota bacterium]MDW8373488.1 copper chaperone PCu(A)C [Planctomycetota bacterium]